MNQMESASRRIFLLACFLFFFASCGKEQPVPNVPLQDVLIDYGQIKNLSSIAAQEDGTAYFIANDKSTEDGDSFSQMYRFSAQGELMAAYDLSDYSMAQAATADNENVYFIAQKGSNNLSLFAFCTDTKQMEELCVLPAFRNVKTSVYLDGRIYVLGQRRFVYSYSLGTGEYDFSGEERLVYYSLETGKLYSLAFEYPINISPQEDGKLAVLAYLPNEGYCLMAYDPDSDTVDIQKRLDAFKFDAFASCDNGKGIIYGYSTNQRGLKMSYIDDLDMEIELFENAGYDSFNLVRYIGGRVYCREDFTGRVVSFPLSAVNRQNQALRMLTYFSTIAPYACGYALDYVEMEWEQAVLKMLAQDQDYDMCLGSTSDNGSAILRDSNHTYPLNDIPGIDAYFDRCFPFVREAAVNESGMVWMFPFSVNLSGMLVSDQLEEQMGVLLYDDMTYQDMKEAIQGLSEEERRTFALQPTEFAVSLFNQYFTHNALPDEHFFHCLESIRDLYQLLPEVGGGAMVPLCQRYRAGLDDMSNQTHHFSVYSLPKSLSTDKNTASCYFLAVNPNSPRLAETLDYIADLIAYLNGRNDIPYFVDFQAEPGSIMEDLHTLYRNAEIIFSLDSEVYLPGLDEMLEGKISTAEYIEEMMRKLNMYLGE